METASRTRWHRLLGTLLEELLSPVGIQVQTEFPVMSEPPEADILLLKNDRPRWSPEQMRRLPDGIRDSNANHVLIEFKYTESVNADALRQAAAYDFFYKRSRKLADKEVYTCLVAAKTTRPTTLKKFSYVESGKKGVYRSENPFLSSITLIALNELPGSSHNAYIKCFASRKKEKKAAFNILSRRDPGAWSTPLWHFLRGLGNQLLFQGGDFMNQEITPEMVMDIGKKTFDAYLASLSPEERKDRLARLRPEDRLAGLTPEDRLAGLKPEDRLAGLKPEDRLAGLTPKEKKRLLSVLTKKLDGGVSG